MVITLFFYYFAPKYRNRINSLIVNLEREKMKKLVLLFAAATMAVSVSAQTVQESKVLDNIYVGINGGVSTKTTENRWLGNLNPNAGLRVGRWFTPVFGLAVESNVYFNDKAIGNGHTVARFLNTSLLGTVNASNLFGGYKGQPRAFEVIAVYGMGWGHSFGGHRTDALTSKAGLDFAFNFGSDKQWQVYIEPSITYALVGNNGYGDNGAYNINCSMVQLNAGLVYKFKNSNGTHNFKIAELRDQAEIDALNAQINDLRNRKPQVVEKIVEAPAKEIVKEVSVSDLIFVTFAQGKSVLTDDAKAALDEVAEGKHVQIVGTASPEGSKAINDKLSQSRADVVADYLKARGVIVDEATGKGVQGTTSNRLAIVYVK